MKDAVETTTHEESALSAVEIARRGGCTDPLLLAKIERAEYLSALVHDAFSWTGRKLSAMAHAISSHLPHHAH